MFDFSLHQTLRGKYIGWGQILIREQFDCVWPRTTRGCSSLTNLDAVARSRRHAQMHSDDQASVNSSVTRSDRSRCCGSADCLAATTNFIDSMDDAVVRSGRFGRLIPVPPPDVQESVEIVAYYLKRVADQSDANRTSRVRVPGQDRLTAIIEPLFGACREDSKFYCVLQISRRP